MFDTIEWVNVEERKPSGYIMIDDGFGEPAEYLVHVKGAEYPTVAYFFDGDFVSDGYDGTGLVSGVDYWAEIPKWTHDK